jgi:proteasome accessory factor A
VEDFTPLILCGIETEYGLAIEGKGPEDQIELATEFVKCYPNRCFVGWDSRFEFPRSDLRGFQVERLIVDPEDQKFERGSQSFVPAVVRADRILTTGGRLYNDHGHPEYATPECISPDAVARQDALGETIIFDTARAFEEMTGLKTTVYKNNTDFHGASYGTHESYLVPRNYAFEQLYKVLMPILVCRQILTGAGKVGSETGDWCDFQLSQRADFMSDEASVMTLHQRPIFNTRDEPHADPEHWMRLHVICGDANRLPAMTSAKVTLVGLGLHLLQLGVDPEIEIVDPVSTFKSISRDSSMKFAVKTARGFTNAREILERYLSLGLDSGSFPFQADILRAQQLLGAIDAPDAHRRIEWQAKKKVVEDYRQEEGIAPTDPALIAVDLEFSRVNPEDGLFEFLCESGEIDLSKLATMPAPIQESRAALRAIAVQEHLAHIETAGWASITFRTSTGKVETRLKPNLVIAPSEFTGLDVESFIKKIEEANQ